MITVAGLTKGYPAGRGLLGRGRRVEVLQGVDLEAGSGEVVGIAGRNGAGKTTLLEILATLVLPDAGHVAVGGHDVVAAPGAVRALVAYCPSSPQAFYPRLTAVENLRFFAALHGVVGAPARDRIREALDAVELDRGSSAPVQTYSDGMRQRLAVARALVARPRVLLLDEPTKSLDPAGRAVVHRLLRSAPGGGPRPTVLVVTHDAGEALAICDRVVVLERGRISEAGLPVGGVASGS